MRTIEHDLINSLDEIAFEERTSDKQKIESIQSLLYQYSQIKDAQSIQLEEQYDTPNMRRCQVITELVAIKRKLLSKQKQYDRQYEQYPEDDYKQGILSGLTVALSTIDQLMESEDEQMARAYGEISDENDHPYKRQGVLTEHGEMGWGIHTLDPTPPSVFQTL